MVIQSLHHHYKKKLPLNLFYNPNSINTLYSQVVAPTLTKQNTRGPLYQPTGANLNLNVNKKQRVAPDTIVIHPRRHATQQWYTAIGYHQLWHLQCGRYLAAGRPTAPLRVLGWSPYPLLRGDGFWMRRRCSDGCRKPIESRKGIMFRPNILDYCTCLRQGSPKLNNWEKIRRGASRNDSQTCFITN